MFTCIHMYDSIYTYAWYVYIYMSIHLYIYILIIYICICIRIYVYVYVYMYMYICICMYVYIYVCTCIYLINWIVNWWYEYLDNRPFDHQRWGRCRRLLQSWQGAGPRARSAACRGLRHHQWSPMRSVRKYAYVFLYNHIIMFICVYNNIYIMSCAYVCYTCFSNQWRLG